jgi:hypothetical protein
MRATCPGWSVRSPVCTESSPACRCGSTISGPPRWPDREIFALQDLIDETTPRSLAGAAVKLRRLVDETSALAADRGSGEVGFGPATSRGDLDHG